MMRVLLDTHLILWSLYKSARLSARAVSLLSDPTTTPMFSYASLWEVEIKHGKNPLTMPVSAPDLHDDCLAAGLRSLAIRPEHIFGIDTLTQVPGASEHGDPFDRMLLAQAKVEGCVLLTHDGALATYGEPCIMLA